MKKILASHICLSILLATGCASLMSDRAKTISFVETDDAQQVVRSLNFELTERPAESCLSGNWKVAKVLSDKERYTRKPAYQLENGKLDVLLVNDICDGYDSYSGTVTDGTFEGEHVAFGLGFSKKLGIVRGTYSGP